ncbi:MAG: lipid-A-disaccharide synthase [Alphaproteobacteria bacterium]|nr:lipid-A-disaccharide synthase [Alphaproteobacteria bacterium]
MTHIYLIAGEASGDFLGAQLMESLKTAQPDIQFSGIGGPLMTAQGLKSLFPMEELSVMGVAEILPKLPELLKRISQTVEDITQKSPDIVVTIDAPDFSFRVTKRARKKTKQTKFVHYVAPTVWAWRPGRAKKISKFLDGLLCLFDFEPSYFEAHGLKSTAVGHPMIESGVLEAQPLKIGADNTQNLGVFFGSRRGEIKRIAPLIIQCVEQIIVQKPDIELIIPTLPHLKARVEELVEPLNAPCHIVTDKQDKWSLFKACDAAIAVSGTVGLELAAAGVPHVIAYKMNSLTWQVVKRVIKTPYAHLVNIMAGKEIVPEFIQGDARAENIVLCVLELLSGAEKAQAQRVEFEEIQNRLGADQNASDKATSFLLT